MVREDRGYVQNDDRYTPASPAGFDLKEQIKVVYRRRRLIITTVLLITTLTASGYPCRHATSPWRPS